MAFELGSMMMRPTLQPKRASAARTVFTTTQEATRVSVALTSGALRRRRRPQERFRLTALIDPVGCEDLYPCRNHAFLRLCFPTGQKITAPFSKAAQVRAIGTKQFLA
jgi:hypothetical protein